MTTPSSEARLATPRLWLEPLVAAHAAPLYAPLDDERLYRFIPQDPPASSAALAARYHRLSSRRSPDGRERWLNWAMRLRQEDVYVGTLEASVDPDRAAADIAYTVFVPHQRRGYAREGLARVLDHLFEDHGVEVVAAQIDTRNTGSIALVEALGFARVGEQKGADAFKGTISDEYHYELRPGL